MLSARAASTRALLLLIGFAMRPEDFVTFPNGALSGYTDGTQLTGMRDGR
jgi:hypothetical protein